MKFDQIKALKPRLRAKKNLRILLDDDSFEFRFPNDPQENNVILFFDLNIAKQEILPSFKSSIFIFNPSVTSPEFTSAFSATNELNRLAFPT